MSPQRRSTPLDFWQRVDIRGFDECWPWTGGVTKQWGYGWVTYQRQGWRAHRLAWTLTSRQGSVQRQAAMQHLYEGGVQEVLREEAERSMTTRERREARAARLREWAGKREVKAETLDKRAHDMADMIPLGQPVIVDSSGYGTDTRYRARIRSTSERAYENADKAREMASKAANIEAATDASIFDDDPDAIEALEARIALAEAERERIKKYNQSCRKGSPDPSVLDDRQRRDLVVGAQVGHLRPNGSFPPYHLSNVGGRISTDRKRLERLRGEMT